MFEQLMAAALGRSGSIRTMVERELNRLHERGYISEDPSALAADLMAKLEGRAGDAQQTVGPMLKELAGSLRETLDIPSRAEVLALTRALERAEAARAERDLST